MLLMTVSASAQIEILYHSTDGTSILTFTAMDRTKKLFWLDDDDNTCFTINNYKKSANTQRQTSRLRRLNRWYSSPLQRCA